VAITGVVFVVECPRWPLEKFILHLNLGQHPTSRRLPFGLNREELSTSTCLPRTLKLGHRSMQSGCTVRARAAGF
jgi:hypothetical protein